MQLEGYTQGIITAIPNIFRLNTYGERMLKVYRMTRRIFTRFSKKPKLLQCYDCEEKFDVGSFVVSVTYSNSCKLRCPDCAKKYGVMSKEEIFGFTREAMQPSTGILAAQ